MLILKIKLCFDGVDIHGGKEQFWLLDTKANQTPKFSGVVHLNFIVIIYGLKIKETYPTHEDLNEILISVATQDNAFNRI